MKKLIPLVLLLSGLALADAKVYFSAPNWVASTVYAPGAYIKPTGQQFTFIAVDGGTSGVGAPTWCTIQNCPISEGAGKPYWVQYPIETKIIYLNNSTIRPGIPSLADAGPSPVTAVFDVVFFTNAANGSTLNVYGDGAVSPIATFTQNCGTACIQTIPAVVLPVSAGSKAYHKIRVQTVEAAVITGTADESILVDYTPSNTGCTVSLTFDDTLIGQYGYTNQSNGVYSSTANTLEKYGMRGTFFVNYWRAAGLINADATHDPGQGYMTIPMLLDLQRRGHEVGDHTLSHLHLPCLSVQKQHEEVLLDTLNLMAAGLQVTGIAYPFGADTPTAWQVDVDGNLAGGRDVGSGFQDVAPARINYSIAAGSSLLNQTLVQLQNRVTACESSGFGGWVVINAHMMYPGGAAGNPPELPASTLTQDLTIYDQFLAWLQPRAANGTVVKTIRQVQGGSIGRLPSWTSTGFGPPPNPGVEDWSNGNNCEVATGGTVPPDPDCYKEQNNGSPDGVATWSQETSLVHSGAFSWKLAVTGHTVGGFQMSTAVGGLPPRPPARIGIGPYYQSDYECLPPFITNPALQYTVSFWYRSDQNQVVRIWEWRDQTGHTTGAPANQVGSWSTLFSGLALPASAGVFTQFTKVITAGTLHSDALYLAFGPEITFVGASTTYADDYLVTQP